VKKILAFILVIGGTAVLFSTAFAPSSWSLSSFKTSKSEAALSSDIQHIQIDSPSISTTVVPQDRQDIKTKVEGKAKWRHPSRHLSKKSFSMAFYFFKHKSDNLHS
jgi:lia operon protein LiaG